MTTTFIHYLREILVGSDTSDVTPQTAFQRFVRTLCCASQGRRASSWFRSSSDKRIGNSGSEKSSLLVPSISACRMFDDIRFTGLSMTKRRQPC